MIKICRRSLLKLLLYLQIILVQITNVCLGQHITRNTYNGETEIKASQSITFLPGFHVPVGSTFKAYITASAESCVPLTKSLNRNVNYVNTFVSKVAGIRTIEDLFSRPVCEVDQTVSYLDGINRPNQTIQLNANPQFKDIVQHFEYDMDGTEKKKYLPFIQADNNGNYIDNPLVAQQSFYSANTGDYTPVYAPFAETVYEKSPLGRPLLQGSQGSYWQVSDHPKRITYTLNDSRPFAPTSGSGSRRVARYKTEVNSSGTRELKRGSNWTEIYPSSSLNVTIYNDENSFWSDCRGSKETYRDAEGKIVLERTYNRHDSGEYEILSTYYVYDEYGNLCFVLPPMAEPDRDGIISKETQDNLCYQYRYDENDRLVEKKIPAKAWEFFVYNRIGQLVMSQDGNQRNRTPQEWTFVKYDAVGREVMTGIYKAPSTSAEPDVSSPSNSKRLQLQSALGSQSVFEKREDEGIQGYSNLSFPKAEDISYYLTICYYDHYNIPGMPGNYNKTGYSNMTNGLPVAVKTAILDNPSDMLWTVMYYDDNGRAVKTFNQHYKGGISDEGGYDEVSSSYSFTGLLQSTERIHKLANTEKLKIETELEYDHAGRRTLSFLKINASPRIVLSRYSYNALGQVKEKKLHSEDGGNTYLQNLSYSYHERGWLKKATSNLFSFELLYDDRNEGDELYDGSLSGFRYGTNLQKTVDYYYDALGRLKKGELHNGSMFESLTYDKAGNIKTLKRDGNTINYNYNYKGFTGNQLASVAGSGLSSEAYDYDKNGNAIKDGSRGNLNIEYNLLNLPFRITGSQNLTYKYDANGKMLSKSGSSGLTEYIYGIQYGNRNGSYGIDFIKTEEGRAVRYSDNSYRYHYDLKDHLGNIRVTFDKDPASGQARKIQEDEYYPFGKRKSVPLPSGAISQDNKYLYNGKDIQDELGQYDYGARFYDPEIARWNVIDPLSESFSPWSPYSYVFNSPVNFTDPDGRAPLGSWGMGGFNDYVLPYLGNGQWDTAPVWRDDVTGPDDPDLGMDRYLKFGAHKARDGGGDILLWKTEMGHGYFRLSNLTGQITPGETVYKNSGPTVSRYFGDGPGGKQGELGVASTVFGGLGLAGDVGSRSKATFRLTNGAYNGSAFSPKFYGSGWRGGSVAQISTYSLSKLGSGVSFGAGAASTYISYDQIYRGDRHPLTYADATVGSMGIITSVASYYTGATIPYVGEGVIIYGTGRLIWDVSSHLGRYYGPSKWYGSDDGKWFK